MKIKELFRLMAIELRDKLRAAVPAAFEDM